MDFFNRYKDFASEGDEVGEVGDVNDDGEVDNSKSSSYIDIEPDSNNENTSDMIDMIDMSDMSDMNIENASDIDINLDSESDSESDSDIENAIIMNIENASDIDIESDNESDNNKSSHISNVENQGDNIDNINGESGGLIYDILHIIDDIYVYGRTLIENNYFNLSENDDFNLVYPNIYIGNYSTSTNYQLLKDLGITHIVSVIPSFNPPFLDKFKYLHIEAYDDESQDMKQHFENSNEFISKCLNEGGKILIHCMVGRSRSITIFLGFLIYIIQGNFHKKNLNLDLEDCTDIYNSIEYNKFIKDKKSKQNSYDRINNQDNLHENINKLEHIKPQFSNKEKNFILYKKEKMLQDVDELIKIYSLLKKEITVFKQTNDNNYQNIEELNNIIKNMKQQSGNHFILQILKYVKTYRKEANPNSYFITQLCEFIF